MLVRNRHVALIEREAGKHERENDQADECGRGAPGEPKRAPVLAHLLTRELVFRLAVKRGCELGDRIAKLRMVERQMIVVVCPPEVDVARLFGERAAQDIRQRVRARPIKIVRGVVPNQVAISETDQKLSVGLVASHRSASRPHHTDAAASGDARKTKNSEPSSASWIDDHKFGFADNDA